MALDTECCYAEGHYAECHYAECHYAECLYAECLYVECLYVECHRVYEKSIIILIIINYYRTSPIGRFELL